MAEKETRNEPKDMIEAIPEEIDEIALEEDRKASAKKEPKDYAKEALESWIPKTKLGEEVKKGKEKDIDKILEKRKKILEWQIVDTLLNLKSDMLLIGQAKGKFGGGKRRAWRQTQKKTHKGNVLSFSAMAVVGDEKGHVGIGFGRARETLPAREKALRNAKLNIMKVNIGFESPEDEQENAIPHTIPFKVEGKVGSSRIILWPAPRGTGLVVVDECKKILKAAGIKDVYSKTQGKTKTLFNLARACIKALEKTNQEIQK